MITGLASKQQQDAGLAELQKQAIANNALWSQNQASNPVSNPVDTSQPSPTGIQQSTDLSKVPTAGVGPQGEQIFDVFAGGQHIADPNDPRLKGVNIPNLPTGTAPVGFKSKFETGFQDANKALGDAGKDVSGAQGTSLVNQYSPTKRNDLSSLFVQSDPFMGDLFKTFQDFINPANQRTSLKDTYTQMIKDTGIQDIDMELVDLKSVIDGTEDDIRTEITKSSGFATNSQVMALSFSRNKQLIKNYNTLLDTRNAKEKYLQTAIGLEQADRQATDQRFDSMFNMGLQIANYQQQMQQNARNQMQWLTTNIGFDGLYDSTNGDPYYTSLVENSLGMNPGGLRTAANQARLTRKQAQEEATLGLQEKKLGIQLKGEQIKTEAAQRAKIYSDMGNAKTEIREVGGKTYLINSTTGDVIKEIAPTSTTPLGQKQLVKNQAQVEQISGLLKDSYLRRSVGPNALVRVSPLNVFTGGKTNFIAGVEQIRSQLNLEALINAKAQGATFGALSDQELQVLASAATKIGTWAIKDKKGNITGYNANVNSFKEELDKINNFAKLDYILKGGKPEDVGVTTNPDGTYWTVDSFKRPVQL